MVIKSTEEEEEEEEEEETILGNKVDETMDEIVVNSVGNGDEVVMMVEEFV